MLYPTSGAGVPTGQSIAGPGVIAHCRLFVECINDSPNICMNPAELLRSVNDMALPPTNHIIIVSWPTWHCDTLIPGWELMWLFKSM